jgi:hypothetical protein
MHEARISSRPKFAVALTGLGGLLMVFGTTLPFVVGSAGGPFEGLTAKGLRTADGKFDLAVGLILLTVAVLIWALRLTVFGTRILAVIAVVGSVIIIYGTVVEIAGVPTLPGRSVGVGLYVELAGGIVGLVGGVLGLIAGGRALPMRPAPEGSTRLAPPTQERPSEPSSS